MTRYSVWRRGKPVSANHPTWNKAKLNSFCDGKQSIKGSVARLEIYSHLSHILCIETVHNSRIDIFSCSSCGGTQITLRMLFASQPVCFWDARRDREADASLIPNLHLPTVIQLKWFWKIKNNYSVVRTEGGERGRTCISIKENLHNKR